MLGAVIANLLHAIGDRASSRQNVQLNDSTYLRMRNVIFIPVRLQRYARADCSITYDHVKTQNWSKPQRLLDVSSLDTKGL